MPEVLPEHPDLDQLRRQAKELHRAAAAGQAKAVGEISDVSSRVDLSSAQHAVARRYGLASWPRLKAEVERKQMLLEGDVDGLRRLLSHHPELAREPVNSCYVNNGPLGYLGVVRFHGITDHGRAEKLTSVLLSAGGPPDGPEETPETPLITAASYGETEMVRVLLHAGADIEARGFAVPGGTALSHAIEFGNVDVVDVLVEAGALVHDLAEAAGVGDVTAYLTRDTALAERARALRSAAVCERVDVIDQLIASGLPVDADTETGEADENAETALHSAAYFGKPRSVRRLLDLGADPNRLDRTYESSPLGWCRHRQNELAMFGDKQLQGHRAVQEILVPFTRDA